MNREQKIREIARQNGWVEEKAKDPTLLIFNRLCDRTHQQVNVWFTRMTVGTYLKHPKQGKTQLFRKYVDMDMLEKIFQNPRLHTGRGYHTK